MVQSSTKAVVENRPRIVQVQCSALAFFLMLWISVCFPDSSLAAEVNAEAQQKVTLLLQKVIREYWNGGDAKDAAATNNSATETNVETAFREASRLMPERLDLRFGIASALVGQALQTNGTELEAKVKGALGVYQEIQTFDVNGFDAPILFAAYSRAIGETNQSDAVAARLRQLYPERTREYLQKFEQIDLLLVVQPQIKPSRTMPSDNHHAIVILGAGLETNGMSKAKLIGRLEQGRKLARLYPHAPIILTGGNQKSGVTESYVMSRWCLQRGIRSKRLILEDKSKDTVENALFSSAILQRLGVSHVTLVTSASHVRRALADFQEACTHRGLKVAFDHLAATEKKQTKLDPEQERLGVYRDVMRASGLWNFPGLRQ